jgi:2-polyprenyl-6-hydroxyphenyl methylase/3-demethylubiquinone-9 3-methyltransferase
MTMIPDYGWTTGAPAHAHTYLQPVVLNTVRTVCSATTTSKVPPKIFDAGCGNGSLLLQLKRAGYIVGGSDASDSGILFARRTLGDDVPLKVLSVYDDLASAFGSDWDVVVATEVIEHLYAPRDFVKRVRALLRPGGALVLSTPYHGYLKNLMLAASGALERHFTALWDGGHIKFWSYRTLTTLLQEAQFKDFRMAGAGRLPWLWKSMVISCVRVG